MESSHTTGNSSTATPGTKTRPSSGLVPNHASAFAMPVPTHHGLTASVDNTPPASVASTSASVPTSSASSSRGTDRPTHVSPFAHSLNSGETAGYPQFSTRLAHDHFNPAHLPMTPGEEMVFDRGLLFASHQPSTRSDPTNALRSAPLPEVPAIDRSSSDPENSAEQNHSGSLPRQIRSTPIHIPAIHHSSPMPSNRASIVHSQGFPSRSPSPNPSTTTQGFAMSHPTPESDISLDHQANGGTHLPYTRPSATPAALRPDSVCSFPDSSPLMAPNVLAAVDARLKESSRQRALAAQPSSSSPRPPRPRSAVLGATHSISSNANSPASSLAPVTTHLAVLQNSESITSKEDLYDILNRDDDDDDVFGSDSEGLGKPRPGFISSGHRSSKSSRPNSSYSSSSAGGGGIELNAKGERLLAASLPRPVQAKVNREGSIKGSKRMELVSAAMVTKDQKENYNSSDSDFGGRILMEKSEWLKRKSRTSRKWRGICCVVGILALVGVIAGIVLGFVTRKGKIDGLAPLPYVPFLNPES
ncbi:hypothetical protein BC939DRAFT_47270 [Gamsiella multidivaricata]|uniref:uncharacterized protein n=1 Tax=Gamsiella multidivaricata TaxID=101098 RepID=UPI0022209DA7|nr:uncharacterized protein BC939DRAFT_47270 [Gamsiella multidivaricata]KAI7828686.1 hypothetical protein BC939DRAFT_47270 [Gamsiella multidivaricata]